MESDVPRVVERPGPAHGVALGRFVHQEITLHAMPGVAAVPHLPVNGLGSGRQCKDVLAGGDALGGVDRHGIAISRA